MISLTAEGSGYFYVYMDGVEMSRHIAEREAIERSVNLKEENPSSVIRYEHRYSVNVDSDAPVPGPIPEPVPEPIPEPVPASLKFRDTFDYVINRDDLNARDTFIQNGWYWAKLQQTNPGANGHIYTVDSIPGFTGSFPAGNRALCIEGRPELYGFQTDFYLQYGNEPEAIPGNAWIQFWIYLQDFGDQPSRLGSRNKFLYPCNGDYPCHNLNWVFQIGNDSLLPEQVTVPDNAGAFLQTWVMENSDISHVGVQSWDAQHLGQSTNERIVPNRWTQVRLHIDTSTPSASYEAWLRPQGGNWVKVAEFIDGQNGVTWRIHDGFVGGSSTMRIPTTWPGGTNDTPHDIWLYLQDFRISDNEGSLN